MRHFRLSLFAHAVSLMAVTAISLSIVCFELHKMLLQETLLASLSLWSLFTVYFWALLYTGVRFDRGLVEGWLKQYVTWDDACAESASCYDLIKGNGDIMVIGGELAGLLAWLLGLAFIAFLAPILLWVGVNGTIIFFLSIFFGLYWVFRRGLRLVMANVKRCKGEYLKSLYVSALHSAGYAALVGGMVFATESMLRLLRS